MSRVIAIVGAAGALLAVSTAASADTFLFDSVLSGLNEVPPNSSPGTGFVQYLFDDSDNSLTILTGTYADLLGDATAAHVHVGPAGVNGGVVIGLSVSGGSSGTIMGGGILPMDMVDDLFAGGLYTNLHSTVHPGGELRDQLVLVPGPTGFACLAVGGLLATRRRR